MEAASPSAVLPDAAAVSLPPNSADETRRSGRDCKSTTMIIDGHVVLTKNNYVLKGGSYSYGVHTADAPKQRKRKEPPQSRDTQSAKTPRRVTPTEQKRSTFNENLKDRVARKAAARLSFLAQNLNVLQPFIEPSVVRKLEAVDIVPAKEQPLYLQPDAIEADLRDYQLEGLNWMVDMYRQNLSCILGDEMVRVLLYVFFHLIILLRCTHSLFYCRDWERLFKPLPSFATSRNAKPSPALRLSFAPCLFSTLGATNSKNGLLH
jgi:hypothetical protein